MSARISEETSGALLIALIQLRPNQLDLSVGIAPTDAGGTWPT